MLALLRTLLGDLLDLRLQLGVGDRLGIDQRHNEVGGLAVLRDAYARVDREQRKNGGRIGPKMQFHGGQSLNRRFGLRYRIRWHRAGVGSAKYWR